MFVCLHVALFVYVWLQKHTRCSSVKSILWAPRKRKIFSIRKIFGKKKRKKNYIKYLQYFCNLVLNMQRLH
jgi:hypothetical protein